MVASTLRSVHAVSVNLILLQEKDVCDGRAVLSDDRAVHIQNVLRAEKGKTLRIGLLNGPLGTGTVDEVESGRVTLRCRFDEAIPSRPNIDLLLAMPRPKVLKRLWAQLAALGVGKIVLVRAEKVERYYFDSHVLEPGFYTKLLIEGLQQARCTHLPEVQIEPLFKPYVEDRFPEQFSSHLKMLADPSGKKRVRDFSGLENGLRILLAVGPEGGWSKFELEMLQERGFDLIGMGDRILRTDTATVALLAQLNMFLATE